MNKKNSPNIGHNKKSLLNSPVEHIDINHLMHEKLLMVWVKCHSHQEIRQELLVFIMKC